MRQSAPQRTATLLAVSIALLLQSTPVDAAQTSAGQEVAARLDPAQVIVIIRSQHKRLTFEVDVKRLAVGDPDAVFAELITSREVLALGKKTGRTTLIVWFGNGTFRQYLVSVEQDLSVLEDALRSVHPTIRVQSAPDRDALVLTGRVPDLATSQLAEAVAQHYLDAGAGGTGSAAPALASAPSLPGQPPGSEPTATPGAAAASPAGRVERTVQPSGTIINLIQLDALPPLPEEKVRDAIRAIGGETVTVRRILRGSVRDDSKDALVLEGRVPNQVTLVRVLTLAAQVFAGETITADDIRVVADEAGGLARQAQGTSQAGQDQSLGAGASSSMFGGSRGARLTNQVRNNLARAKAIEVAGGRVLSFIEVADLPQVRVDIRLVEVNRSKLRAMDGSATFLTSSFRQPSLNPSESATAVQGDQAARVGASGAAIQNVLSFLNGILKNQLQYSGANFAIDAVLSALEREGIAQSLSSTSLTVLSGEMAQVQVGGEIPVPTAFAPAFGTPGVGATPGVFSSVEFVPFGVQLQIRPLVGDDDTITLDVQPIVMTPDALLTGAIREATGGSVPTTAFQTRALRTSSRLRDGEALVIGGLTSGNTSTNDSALPWLARVPLLGRLLGSTNRNDQTTELVIVVNPVVLRTPRSEVGMWAFPDRGDLMGEVLASVARATNR